MSDYEIIDVHIHTYQTPEIGIQAMGGAARCGYTGTIDETLSLMKKENISKAVMVNLLPTGEMREALMLRLAYGLADYAGAEKGVDATLINRAQRRNQWSCEQSREHPELLSFITLDPVMDPFTMRNEILDKVNNQGAKGIKLHPSAQRFYPFDRRMWPCYETAQELDLPILSHGGIFEESPAQFAEPKYFLDALAAFPNLRLVIAHIGRPFWDQAKDMVKKYPNLNFDCCGIMNPEHVDIPDDFLVSLIREIGADRVMYGSDFPFIDPIPQLKRIMTLNFTQEEKRLILGENAKRILKLQ